MNATPRNKKKTNNRTVLQYLENLGVRSCYRTVPCIVVRLENSSVTRANRLRHRDNILKLLATTALPIGSQFSETQSFPVRRRQKYRKNVSAERVSENSKGFDLAALPCRWPAGGIAPCKNSACLGFDTRHPDTLSIDFLGGFFFQDMLTAQSQPGSMSRSRCC